MYTVAGQFDFLTLDLQWGVLGLTTPVDSKVIFLSFKVSSRKEEDKGEALLLRLFFFLSYYSSSSSPLSCALLSGVCSAMTREVDLLTFSLLLFRKEVTNQR